MSLNARRATYVGVIVLAMATMGWEVVYDMWRAVLGDDAGEAMARFWDLQVESYWNALLFVLVLDFVYGMHRGADGGWEFSIAPWRVHGAVYAALAVLTLVCSAEGPLRNVLEVPLPDDIANSVAHYFRRALEGVMATIGLMIFMDFVRPGRVGLPRGSHPPAPAGRRSGRVAPGGRWSGPTPAVRGAAHLH